MRYANAPLGASPRRAGAGSSYRLARSRLWLRPPRPLRAFVVLILYSQNNSARPRGPRCFAPRSSRLWRLQSVMWMGSLSSLLLHEGAVQEHLRADWLDSDQPCRLRRRRCHGLCSIFIRVRACEAGMERMSAETETEMGTGLGGGGSCRGVYRTRGCLLGTGCAGRDAAERGRGHRMPLRASTVHRHPRKTRRPCRDSPSSPPHPHVLLLQFPPPFNLCDGQDARRARECRRRAASLSSRTSQSAAYMACLRRERPARRPARFQRRIVYNACFVRGRKRTTSGVLPSAHETSGGHTYTTYHCACVSPTIPPMRSSASMPASAQIPTGVPGACGAVSSCGVHTILASTSSPGLRRAAGRSGCLGAGERWRSRARVRRRAKAELWRRRPGAEGRGVLGDCSSVCTCSITRGGIGITRPVLLRNTNAEVIPFS
ncbi:hypothetical protein B0H17DRAFT_208416 [Mycena rosella]|uniref:Uncharacterized protein n=1 Tax=Mycena rosella TaxID=1033263 RepID=A0AAD7G9A1_MYCRO|nr:hypothetical protein B0H17DRAFT_208416 [Mycena rosella]